MAGWHGKFLELNFLVFLFSCILAADRLENITTGDRRILFSGFYLFYFLVVHSFWLEWFWCFFGGDDASCMVVARCMDGWRDREKGE